MLKWFKHSNDDSYVGDWTALKLNAREYIKRILGAVKYLFFYALIVTLVASIIAGILFLIPGESNPLNAFKSTMSTATGLATPVDIDSNGIHANMGIENYVLTDESSAQLGTGDLPAGEIDSESGVASHFDWGIFGFIILEAFLITSIGMLFSGAFSAVFLRPINPIKIAPFVVLRPDALYLRFWVCYPTGKFLHNVSVSLRFYYDRSYQKSIFEFTGNANDSNECLIQKETYGMVHGVWEVKVPMGSEASINLLKALKDKTKHPEAGVQLLIQGETDSGEFVDKTHKFEVGDILTDYIYASYHYPFDKPKGENGKAIDPRQNHLWFSNFMKLVSIEEIKAHADWADSIRNVNTALLEEQDSLLQKMEDSLLAEKGERKKIRRMRKNYKGWLKFLKDCGDNSNQELLDHVVSPSNCWTPYLSHKDRVKISKM